MGRILDYPEKPSPGLNDYLLVDSSSEGTKKISASNIVTVDSSLTQPGQPADAKKTGDEIASIKTDLDNIPTVDPTLTKSGQAADSKVVGDKITHLKEDLSESKRDIGYYVGMPIKVVGVRIHGSTQKWIVEENYLHIMYPIKGGEQIDITAQPGHTAYYIVLTDSDHTVGTTPKYATGYSGGYISISGGRSVSINVPSDGRYLMVLDDAYKPNIVIDGNNVSDINSNTPIQLRLADVEKDVDDIVADTTVAVNDLQKESATTQKYVGVPLYIEDERIHAGTNKWITDSGYKWYMYPVFNGDVVDIAVNVGYSSYYTVLASGNHDVGTTPIYATGYSGGTVTVPGGTTVSVAVPQNARYLMVNAFGSIPIVTINNHNVTELYKNDSLTVRISDVEKEAEHIDENTYNAIIDDIDDRQNQVGVDYLQNNLKSMLKYKNGTTQSTQRISFTATNARKQILHLHKRANNGFDQGNNAYLPNAQSDFSDIRVIADNGEYLPYYFVYRGNVDILQDSRLGLNSNSNICQNSHGTLIAMVDTVIKQSDDNGETWTAIAALASFSARPRVLYISDSDTLFFEASGVLYRSAYPYSTYAQVYDHTAGKTGVAINGYGFVGHPNGSLFFGAYQTTPRVIEIYRSTDDGVNWTRVYYQEETYQHVHSMYVDINQSPVAVYAGLDGGGGVLKSVDGGNTWVDLRAEYPNMPQTTDYGVIYAGLGVRLLGGETGVVGGHSIIRTTNDSTFTPALSTGNGFMRGVLLDNKVFLGGTGANTFTNAVILMSTDNGLTFKQVFTEPDVKESGVTDGFKYLSVLTDTDTNENYIAIKNQHTTLPPVRIYSGGSNYYAEIIVDIPEGCTYVDVESGYLCQYAASIYNDYNVNAQKYVDFGLNEGNCIKEKVSGAIYRNNFRYLPNGKNMCSIYPFVETVADSKSIALDSLSGYNFALPLNFTSLSGITVELWFAARNTIDVNLMTFGTHSLRFKGYSVYDGNTSFVTMRGRINEDTIVKGDIVIDFANNTVTSYINGVQVNQRTDATGLIDIIKAWNGESRILEVNACSEYDQIQNFVVYGRVLTADEIKYGYTGKLIGD